MNNKRLSAAFGRARAQKRAALIPFITAGFPFADSTLPILTALAKSGADIIELGVPFSDPSADGAAIQRASETALANGITLQKVVAQVGTFRQTDKTTPIVLMGYANTFFRMGRDKFMTAAKQNGIDGLIVVDFSDDERPLWRESGRQSGVDVISLVAPTTTTKRQAQLASESAGFVYFIALKGVTGAHHIEVDTIAARINELKQVAKVPVAAGFGVRDAKQAKALAQCADGVVIGSRLTEVMEAAPKQAAQNAAVFINELAGALV